MNERDVKMLAHLQQATWPYFAHYADPKTGLVADRTAVKSPSSIAATGLALAVYPIAVEHGWWSREDAIERTLVTLRFLVKGAAGHRGFFYHFLDMHTGGRASSCELSTIDTALLIAGVHTAALYFSDERELCDLADELYRRVDWKWASTEHGFVRHGWTPEHGFLELSWDRGYSEALLLYVLALGSPTHAIDPRGYREWTTTYERVNRYGQDHFYAGPLFIHQLPQIWLDLRNLSDAATRAAGFDYFENSRRATLMQRAYAIDNPNGFTGYGENAWGFTACDGPGPAKQTVHGVPREFFAYLARGAPFGPDDGTLSPWAIAASLPFAPVEVCAALHHAIDNLGLGSHQRPGFEASYNPTFPVPSSDARGWVASTELGLNQGPIIAMIENHSTELIWNLCKTSPYFTAGLIRAGFSGGWLDAGPTRSAR